MSEVLWKAISLAWGFIGLTTPGGSLISCKSTSHFEDSIFESQHLINNLWMSEKARPTTTAPPRKGWREGWLCLRYALSGTAADTADSLPWEGGVLLGDRVHSLLGLSLSLHYFGVIFKSTWIQGVASKLSFLMKVKSFFFRLLILLCSPQKNICSLTALLHCMIITLAFSSLIKIS